MEGVPHWNSDIKKNKDHTITKQTMASSTPTIRLHKADLSKIIFGEKQPPLDPKIGLENVFISYENDKQWPRFQFPFLEHRFNAFKQYDDSVIGPNEPFVLTLSFDPTNPRHAEVMKKLREFDDKVLGIIQDNPTWLKKPWTNDNEKSYFMEAFWNPSLKVAKKEKNGTTNEYFSIKLRVPKRGQGKDSKITTQFKDAKTGEDIDYYEPLKGRCDVQVIGRPARIYIQKGQKAGIVWEATVAQIKRDETENVEKELFLNDSDEEDKEDKKTGADPVEDDKDEEESDVGIDELAIEDADTEEIPEEKTKPAAKGRGKKTIK